MLENLSLNESQDSDVLPTEALGEAAVLSKSQQKRAKLKSKNEAVKAEDGELAVPVLASASAAAPQGAEGGAGEDGDEEGDEEDAGDGTGARLGVLAGCGLKTACSCHCGATVKGCSSLGMATQ